MEYNLRILQVISRDLNLRFLFKLLDVHRSYPIRQMAVCRARHPGMPVPCAPTLVQRVTGLAVAQLQGVVRGLGVRQVGVDRNQVALVSGKICMILQSILSMLFV